MALVNTIVTDEVRAAYVKPEAKKQEATGSKKAARKAEKAAAYKAAAEEKAKRVAEQQKLEAAAAERKAKRPLNSVSPAGEPRTAPDSRSRSFLHMVHEM